MTDLGTQLTFKVSSLASHPNFNSIGSQVSPSNRVVGLGSRVLGPTQTLRVSSLGSRI